VRRILRAVKTSRISNVLTLGFSVKVKNNLQVFCAPLIESDYIGYDVVLRVRGIEAKAVEDSHSLDTAFDGLGDGAGVGHWLTSG
jgi:hypothetical protein